MSQISCSKRPFWVVRTFEILREFQDGGFGGEKSRRYMSLSSGVETDKIRKELLALIGSKLQGRYCTSSKEHLDVLTG